MKNRSLLALLLLPVPLVAQGAPDVTVGLAEKFTWRALGPSTMGGRIVELAVYEKDPTIWWAATASGGLLKTSNNGISFEHQFDREGVVSIGSVCVAQSDPNIVWVGTGEENPRNSVSYGDGVYKSVDGGKTWKNMGLKETFQIGCIQVHPTNPDIVYVGALGRLYGPNEQRGLFKTTDGGTTWKKIHYIDDKTGVIDIQMQPGNPDTLIFATYERWRDGFDGNAPAKKIAPGSGLYRTTDGGKTVHKLTKGLPTCNYGRVGIDFWRKDPNVVFAIIETEMMGKPGANVGWSGIDTVADADAGCKVTALTRDGPAAKAGLKVDDVILKVNEKMVLKGSELKRILYSFEVDDLVTIQYVRDGQSSEAAVTMAKRPERQAGGGRGRGGFGGGRGGFGGRRGGQAGEEQVVTTSMNVSFGGRLGGESANLQHFQGKNGHEHGGVFRSDDGGTSWKRINSIDPRPMYFSQFRVDPTDTDHQFVLGISGERSKDGGETFTSDFTRGVHADHHALWINPANPRHMILGCDGGIYMTYDRGDTWDHYNHMAIGQFYHVAVGPRRDYWVYGGLQDNGSWGAPHRGAINEDWIRIGSGDGFVVRVDKNDPNQLYAESQNGATQRLHLVTGERGRISPESNRGGGQRGGGQRGGGQRGGGQRGGAEERRGGEQGEQGEPVTFERGQRSRYRYNWKTPFILSHHNSKIYYNAGNHVFRSLDRGNDLKQISPEITLTDRGSGTALAESPLNPDVLYVGSDDGALWGTRKGDHDWVDLRKTVATAAADASAARNGNGGNDDTEAGVPFTSIVKKPMWISSIEASRFKEGRVYVTVDAHRSDDDNPYVLVSDDYGMTWFDLRGNLPRGSTRAIREDRVNENLLYLGTEFGLYISLNQGGHWIRFHNNLPTVAIHDIAQHEQCGDIVVATHGRSLWACDVTMLRQLNSKILAEDVAVFDPADVVRFPRGQSRGTSAGARRFVGDQPSSQTQIYFYLKSKPQQLTVTIHDQKGEKIRDIDLKQQKVPLEAGLHHVTWDGGRNPRQRGAGGAGGAGGQLSREEMIQRFRRGGGGGFGRGGFGRGGATGTYKVVVYADGKSAEAEFEIKDAPKED